MEKLVEKKNSDVIKMRDEGNKKEMDNPSFV